MSPFALLSRLYFRNVEMGNCSMAFNSLQFVAIFMPVFFLCYYLVPNWSRNLVLLLGSLVFYFIGTIHTPYHFILLVACIIVDFFVGLGLERCQRHKRAILAAGVLFHLILLCAYKYTYFIQSELSRVFSGVNEPSETILPIGISFYTFQGISYIADVYQGTAKAEKSLLNFAVYISMFPKLTAGPIVKYGQIEKELRSRRIRSKTVYNGLGLFLFGLGLKVLLANPIGKLWTQTRAIGFESISTPLAWMAVIAYSFHIYFDFFGYSLMAVGLGRMLGFRLHKNFKHPYTSLTMSEYWRRWHITLGDWFKEYIYIPLGGNRTGTLRTVRNLLIVWLLTGIWHGAGYNFILWGLILFGIILVEKLFIGTYLTAHPVLGHLYMALLIPLTWAVFAVTDISQLGVLFSRLFPFFGQCAWSIFPQDYLKYLAQYYPFLIAGVLFSTKLPYGILKRVKNRAVICLLLSAVLTVCLYCMYRGQNDPFLYFQF